MTIFFKERDYLLYSLDGLGNETLVDRFAFNTVVKPKEKCE